MRRTPIGGHRDSHADSGMGGARNPPDARTRFCMDDKWRRGRGKHHTNVHARLAKRHAAREIPETGGAGDFTRDIAQAAKRQQTNFTRQARGDHSAARVARGRSQRAEAEPVGRGGTGAGEPPPTATNVPHGKPRAQRAEHPRTASEAPRTQGTPQAPAVVSPAP